MPQRDLAAVYVRLSHQEETEESLDRQQTAGFEYEN